MRQDEIERRLVKIEESAEKIKEEAKLLRVALDRGETADERWARMMYAVLSEIDRRGGAVPRREVVEIGKSAGYNGHGLAGFYQKMLKLDKNNFAHLTDDGRRRLETLRPTAE